MEDEDGVNDADVDPEDTIAISFDNSREMDEWALRKLKTLCQNTDMFNLDTWRHYSVYMRHRMQDYIRTPNISTQQCAIDKSGGTIHIPLEYVCNIKVTAPPNIHFEFWFDPKNRYSVDEPVLYFDNLYVLPHRNNSTILYRNHPINFGQLFSDGLSSEIVKPSSSSTNNLVTLAVSHKTLTLAFILLMSHIDETLYKKKDYLAALSSISLTSKTFTLESDLFASMQKLVLLYTNTDATIRYINTTEETGGNIVIELETIPYV